MSGYLSVQNLGKSYKNWGSEKRRLASWFIPSIQPRAEHWVLRKVSFAVAPGESIGVVGQNGAGKSTLLKLITGTTHPTEGHVQLRGRVSAILELGMGFNPDLTGRQNAGHSAGLMGFSGDEIERIMPEIEAFSEIGDYFNQPVRTYSSGMQMRLAFSVVTAIRPDVLIVDEVLSVGDSYFQHKSFNRIRQFREEGTSIMLVSHNLSDVRTLCDRAILLDQGKVIKDGQPDEVVDYYNALIAEKENRRLNVIQKRSKKGWLHTRSGTGEASVSSLMLLDAASGKESEVVDVGQELELRIAVSAHADVPKLVIGCSIRDRQGNVIWGTNTWHTRQVEKDISSGEQVIFSLRFFCNLGPGSYSISTALHSTDTHLEDNYEWHDNLLVFEVINTGKPVFVGVNWLDASTSIARQNCHELLEEAGA